MGVGIQRLNSITEFAGALSSRTISKSAFAVAPGLRLPSDIEKDYKENYEEYEDRETLEAKCAKDADYLEQALTAKEYVDVGYKGCGSWIVSIKNN